MISSFGSAVAPHAFDTLYIGCEKFLSQRYRQRASEWRYVV